MKGELGDLWLPPLALEMAFTGWQITDEYPILNHLRLLWYSLASQIQLIPFKIFSFCYI